MAVKEWVKKFQPLSLYTMVVLTTFYFLVQLVVSYSTHALTLTVDSYLMLCNLIALLGYASSIKYGGLQTITENISMMNVCSTNSSSNIVADIVQVPSTPTAAGSSSKHPEKPCPVKHNTAEDGRSNCSSIIRASGVQCTYPVSEKRMKNTFGWARIDVLVMLIGCIFFASLCLAMVIQACQTLTHITHHDEMHHPIPVLCVGAFGLVLNGLCYLLIGGFTFHQGSFLRVTSSGAVVLDNVLSSSFRERNRKQQQQLNFHSCSVVSAGGNSSGTSASGSDSNAGRIALHPARQRHQGPWEMSRDAIGCICVIICGLTVYLSDPSVAKYVDPIIAIISAILLLFLSYPYMKESCLILLQTIPDHINIDSLCYQLIKTFPDIVNVHDLHVWQLTADKTISTVHLIFLNPQVYARVTKDITDFFHEQGITQVTIQPEFFKDSNSVELISGYGMGQCLMKCNKPECYQRYCCDMADSTQPVTTVAVIPVNPALNIQLESVMITKV